MFKSLVATVIVSSVVFFLDGSRSGSGSDVTTPLSPRQEAAKKATEPSAASAVSKPQSADLGNGLHLLVVEDHRVPAFTLQLHLQGAGAYFDPPDAVGLASVAATVTYRSTPTLSFDDLEDLWKELDADVNMLSRGGSSVTVLGGKGPARHLRRYLEVVAEFVTTPQFTDAELKAVQDRARSAVNSWRSTPRFVLDEAFLRALNGQHPTGVYEPLASPAVYQLTTAQLAAFAKERYVPDHAVLAIAGDVTFADVKKQVEETLGNWKRSGRPVPETKRPSEPVARLRFADMPTVQANISVGTLVASRGETDFDALDVLTSALSVGTPGRLSSALASAMPPNPDARDRPSATLTSQRNAGTWRVNATVKPDAVGQALDALDQQIARLRTDLVSPEELEAAKKAVIQRYLADRESAQTRLGNALAIKMLSLPADYWDTRADKVSAVTAEQVRAAAKKYLDPKRLVTAIVGPRATIEPQLKKLSVPMTFVAANEAGTAQP